MRECRDIPFDICLDLGPGRVEDMSRHLPRNLVTRRDVMSCRDICQDTSANASAPLRGTNFGKISGVETEEILCDSCRFDVVLCDFSGIFEILPDFSVQNHAFRPRAQRAERNFSPAGPNVMSCRDKWLDFQTDFSHLSLSCRDK